LARCYTHLPDQLCDQYFQFFLLQNDHALFRRNLFFHGKCPFQAQILPATNLPFGSKTLRSYEGKHLQICGVTTPPDPVAPVLI
jgi:hypothetical protein